ncbi:hypothetical protein V1281_001498 [Nitrobacteraceae bacterium AZCC 2161]
MKVKVLIETVYGTSVSPKQIRHPRAWPKIRLCRLLAQRLFEVDQRLHQFRLRRFAGPRRILEKILDVVPGKGISRAVPENDTRVRIVRRLVEMPARATYMADVIAFRLVGRFN